MIKLEVGDNIILRDDLAIDNYYGSLRLYKNMLSDMDSGKTYKIRVIGNTDGTFKTTNCSWWFSNEMVDWDKTTAINKNLKDNGKYIVKVSEDSGLIFDEASKCVYISDFYCLEDCRIELTEDEIKNSAYPYLWRMAELAEEEGNA